MTTRNIYCRTCGSPLTAALYCNDCGAPTRDQRVASLSAGAPGRHRPRPSRSGPIRSVVASIGLALRRRRRRRERTRTRRLVA